MLRMIAYVDQINSVREKITKCTRKYQNQLRRIIICSNQPTREGLHASCWVDFNCWSPRQIHPTEKTNCWIFRKLLLNIYSCPCILSNHLFIATTFTLNILRIMGFVAFKSISEITCQHTTPEYGPNNLVKCFNIVPTIVFNGSVYNK